MSLVPPPADVRTTFTALSPSVILRLPQITEPACHPFPIRDSLLGLTSSHDRWCMSMVRLMWDLNWWPFGLEDQELCSGRQCSTTPSDVSLLSWWVTRAERAKLVITPKKKKSWGGTHTLKCMRKCCVRADSSCYEVLTSVQCSEEPALWWTSLRLSVGSALFTAIGSDRIVKVRYWHL